MEEFEVEEVEEGELMKEVLAQEKKAMEEADTRASCAQRRFAIHSAGRRNITI